MIKPVQSILFATDLTKNCQQALEYTITMGIRFNAVIHMLHVIEEDLPNILEDQMKDLLGTHRWDELADAKKQFVKKSLLGKKSTNIAVREKIQDFCKLADINEGQCNFQSQEIIISGGEVVEDILTKAKEKKCDLIVMGAKESFFSQNSIGTIIKSVLKGSPVPVTIVPARPAEED